MDITQEKARDFKDHDCFADFLSLFEKTSSGKPSTTTPEWYGAVLQQWCDDHGAEFPKGLPKFAKNKTE